MRHALEQEPRSEQLGAAARDTYLKLFEPRTTTQQFIQLRLDANTGS
jgi:hypothetical protein